MTPVDQTIVDKGIGDCTRAAVASILDVRIEMVPHFILYENWIDVFMEYMGKMGWQYVGVNSIPSPLHIGHSINGYFLGTVASKTYEGVTHTVVVNRIGEVAHDPNPNKLWHGVNVYDSKELLYWKMFKPMPRKWRIKC